MQVGDVVVALAGKEKNNLYIIVKEENGYFYIADGDKIKKQKPKKKNPKHLHKASKNGFLGDLTLCEERINAEIRKFLNKERICQKKM